MAGPWEAYAPAPEAAPEGPWTQYEPSVVDKAKGLAKAGGIGVAQGLIGMAGAFGTGADLIGRGVEKIAPGYGQYARKAADPLTLLTLGQVQSPTGQDVQGTVEKITGKFYDPQTTGEKYARTIGEFAPAAVGPGGPIRNLLKYGVAPGVAAETAGQATEGTALEPYARAGAGILAGGTAAALSRPRTAEGVLSRQLSENVTPAVVDQARQLMREARQQGVRLTWAEAIEQTAPGSGLTGTQRVLESAAQTRPQMERFFAGRPAEIEAAGRSQMDAIATPPSANPSTIGPAVQEAAEETITGIRQAINRATRPMYDAAGQTLVPQAVHAAMMQDPHFAATLNAIRNDPARNSVIRGQSDRSVAVYDAVKQELSEAARNAAHPTNPNASQTVAAAHSSLAGDVRQVATQADRLAVGHGPSNYEAALGIQASLRERYLNPILAGPLGRLAQNDLTTKKAIDALFPSNPLPNSEREIATAVRALTARRPAAAEQLVRAHIESVFNEATQALQSGAAQAGGAKFAAVIAGNPQQRANLRAAVEALPNGAARWQGFERFLDVMQATGTRQHIGSKTAFNAQELAALRGGTLTAETAKVGLSPARWTTVVADKWGQWQQGRNLNELARILTDPGSHGVLRQIAGAPRGSGQAQALAARIILLTMAGQTNATTAPNQ